jgi:hypothetical protein
MAWATAANLPSRGMRRAAHKPRRRQIALIASLACALVAGLTVAPATSAQQGSAQDQYRLDLPNATDSQRGGAGASSATEAPPGLSAADAHRLARGAGGDTAGGVVWVLAVGLAAISCAGGVVAYRRRQLADQTQ